MEHLRVHIIVYEGIVTLSLQFSHTVPLLAPIQKSMPLKKRMPLRIAPSLPPSRNKAFNKINEEEDVALLVQMLNDPVKGRALRDGFSRSFPGKSIICATIDGPAGSRNAHYDFQIQLNSGEWLKVEHKGCQSGRPIDTSKAPWTGGVQFSNGGMEKYRLARKYAEEWYDIYIGSLYLTNTYGLSEPIPTKEEWMLRDAKVQGDPKTPFGKELKRVVRESGSDSLLSLRNEFVPGFVERLTQDDSAMFLEDAMTMIQSAFHEKDVWLQVSGSVKSGVFYFYWSPSLSVESLHHVRFVQEKDVVGYIESSGCPYPIRCILRWGKGAGFSNLRIDLK
jgi:hypothetical protein